VIRDAGQTGTLEGANEMAKLFAQVSIRTLSYRLGERTVEVAPEASDHAVEGNRYVNPWLGLTVVKPQEAAFTGLDEHWPGAPAVLTVARGEAAVQVLYVDSESSGPELLTRLLGEQHEAPAQLKWNGLAATRARAGDREALVAPDGDVAWALLARGPGAHALLESLLPATTIAPAL
jgi:hypothetical protein